MADTYDIDDLDAADTAEMTVLANDGTLTKWIWTFAGPGHSVAIAQATRLARERLHEDAQKEQARVNGRKWKAPEETVDQVRAKNVEFVVERLVGWSGASRAGKPFAFSAENAREVLMDRRKSGLLTQALEYLGETSSFTQNSAASLSPTEAATSN